MRISDCSSTCALPISQREPQTAADSSREYAQVRFVFEDDGLDFAWRRRFERAQAVGQCQRIGDHPERCQHLLHLLARSAERRVGNEWFSTSSSRWSPYHLKKNQKSHKQHKLTK